MALSLDHVFTLLDAFLRQCFLTKKINEIFFLFRKWMRMKDVCKVNAKEGRNESNQGSLY